MLKLVKALNKPKSLIMPLYRASSRLLRENFSLKKAAIAALGLILVTALSGYFIGISLTSSESRFLTRFHRLIHGEDPYKAMKYIRLEGNGGELSKEQLTPYFEYLKQDPSRIRALLETVKKNNNSSSLGSLKKQDRLFGTKYWIELKPVEINISIPYAGTEIYLNETHVATTDKDNASKLLSGLVPGAYTVKAVFENEYGENIVEQKLLALSGKSNIALKMQARLLTIESNYADAYVYINGRNTEILVRDFKEVGPFPGNDPIKAYVERSFPWGTIKSIEAEVTGSPKLRLNINPLIPELKLQLDEAYKSFYEGLFSALSAGKPDRIKGASESVKIQLYEKFNKDSAILKNSYSIRAVEYEQGVIALQPDGNTFTASANITAAYKTSKNILGIALPGSYKTETRKFKTILTYDSQSNGWIVTSVTEL